MATVTPKLATIDTFKNIKETDQTEAANDAFIGVASELNIPTGIFNVEAKRISPRPTYNSYNHYNSWNRPATPATPVIVVEHPTFLHVTLRERDENNRWIDTREVMAKPTPTINPNIVSFSIFQEHRNNWYCRIGSGYGEYCALIEVRLADGQVVPIACTLKIAEKLLGFRVTENSEIIVNGRVIPCPDAFKVVGGEATSSYRPRENQALTHGALSHMRSHFNNTANSETLIRTALKKITQFPALQTSGVSKIFKTVNALAEQAGTLDPLALVAFRTFAAYTHRTIEGVRISALFNDTFKDVKTKFDLLAAVEPFQAALAKHNHVEKAFEQLPEYIARRKAALKSRNAGAYTKFLADIESITGSVDKAQYPKTFKAIEDGELPVSLFFRSHQSEQYFLLNDNWPLWEKMLSKHRETTLAIAQEAASRTYYEKDLMSYFFFVLNELPAYLRKHTGKNWTCSPKLVDDPNELNPPTTTASGTAKTRSALTPIVDNVKRTVVVPYASVGMPGQQTTYCYSHEYHVVQKGLTINGNVALSDIEEKLNGRDDYGLMFYTLTGSVQGRGYPTFLIIFERLGQGTRVHFHRIHPSRSKNGDYNPIHNWTKSGYNWMVGNVARDRIKAQQGDLAFVSVDNPDLVWERKVEQYDHHCFDAPVDFAPYTKAEKSNILGYVKLDEQRTLSHHEHEQRIIPAGTYEIRQARSWEANPAGVWSLRID